MSVILTGPPQRRPLSNSLMMPNKQQPTTVSNNVTEINFTAPKIEVPKEPEEKTTGIFTVVNEYGTMKVSTTSVEEHMRRVMMTMEKRHIAYKYYSSIWTLSAVALCFFITSGFAGLMGPLSSIVGAVMSLIGIAGSLLDWKDWGKRNANKFIS